MSSFQLNLVSTFFFLFSLHSSSLAFFSLVVSGNLWILCCFALCSKRTQSSLRSHKRSGGGGTKFKMNRNAEIDSRSGSVSVAPPLQPLCAGQFGSRPTSCISHQSRRHHHSLVIISRASIASIYGLNAFQLPDSQRLAARP